MNKKTVWFSAFKTVVPADFEEWMESLAKEGWNVDKLGLFGAFKIVFYKSEPKKFRYVFDLNINPKKDYMQTYEQFGWEYVGRMSSCFIWRKAYDEIRPESFTDKESRIRRNKNMKNAYRVNLIMMLAAVAAVLTGCAICVYIGEPGTALALTPVLALTAAVSVYFSRVIRRINDNLER